VTASRSERTLEDEAKSVASTGPDVSLRPGAGYLWLFRASLCFGSIVAVGLAVEASRDPDWAGAARAWQGAAVILAVGLVGILAVELTNLHVDFFSDRILIRKGIQKLARPTVIYFSQVTRVRAYDFPNLRVVLDLADGRSVKVANSMTSVRGSLPEVEHSTGPILNPMIRMRQIQLLIERRAARAQSQALTP